jgi:hypothetical protein
MEETKTYYSQYQRSSLTALLLVTGTFMTNVQAASPTSNFSTFTENSIRFEAAVIPFKRKEVDDEDNTCTTSKDIFLFNVGPEKDIIDEEIHQNQSGDFSVNFLNIETSYTKSNVVENDISSIHYNNYLVLNYHFHNEAADKSFVVDQVFDVFQNSFQKLATTLSELPFEKSAVEITKNLGLKFTFTFKGDKTLRITKVVEDEQLIFYSYFENKKLVSANANKLEDFVDGFKEYLAA